MKRDENSENQDNVSQEILGMALDNKYSAKPQIPEASVLQKEMEKTKKEMEKLKGTLVKKYPFIQSISILPPQTIKRFIDEEEAPPETEKYIHLYIITSGYHKPNEEWLVFVWVDKIHLLHGNSFLPELYAYLSPSNV